MSRRTRYSYAARALFVRCSCEFAYAVRTLFVRCSYERELTREPRTTRRARLLSRISTKLAKFLQSEDTGSI